MKTLKQSYVVNKVLTEGGTINDKIQLCLFNLTGIILISLQFIFIAPIKTCHLKAFNKEISLKIYKTIPGQVFKFQFILVFKPDGKVNTVPQIGYKVFYLRF